MATPFLICTTLRASRQKKTVTTQGVAVTNDYLDGYHYEDGQMRFFPTAEGYVRLVYAKIVRFVYVFNYVDHLGNIRVSYSVDPSDNVLKITEENHYYPFGLKHKNYNVTKLKHEYVDESLFLQETAATGYNYKYNGKEFQDELGLNFYDYGARNYDPAIGRWMNIDPLAERHTDFTPYMYTANNPVIFIDPDGMDFTLHGADAKAFVSALQGLMKDVKNNSDNDCPSCKTKSDWAAYHKQAEYTENVMGVKLEHLSTEDGYTIYSHNGEILDLKKYDSRAEAFGSLLNEAALIEAPIQLLKMVGKFYKSDSAYSIEKFLESAIKPWGEQGLTNVGRALQKHAGRKGSVFEGIKFSHKTANEDALNIVKNIIFSKDKTIQLGASGGYNVFDQTTGMGFGISRDGLFNGFREITK